MTGPRQQLSLPFPINQRFVLGNFEIGENAEVVQRLEAEPDRSVFSGLWLWGGGAVGVSHLLHGVCHWHAARGARVAYLPLEAVERDPAVLEGLDFYDLLALDDVGSWAGDLQLESALMAMYERLFARRARLIVGAAGPVARCGFRLADLASRLSSLTAYEVRPLNDEGKVRLLRRLAKERGLELSDAVLGYWLARSHRSVRRLLDDLEVIDAEAMRAQRVVTIPLLKDALGL
jgi:DnaA family protein